MAKVTALVLMCVLLICMRAHADEAPGAPPRWAIILTITDLTTGNQVEQKELDPEIEFADADECRSMIARIGPIPGGDNFGTVLTCREIGGGAQNFRHDRRQNQSSM